MAALKPTTRYQATTTVGGNGGTPFDLKIPGHVVKRVEVWSAPDRLRGIRLTFTDASQHLAGKAKGALSTFELNLGETIDLLNLYSSPYRNGRSGGFDFRTTRGRSFAVGPRSAGKVQAAGGYLGGVLGRAGSDVDRLGFYYVTDVVSYFLKNVTYDLSKAQDAGMRPVALATAALINSSPTEVLPMNWDAPVDITTVKHWTSTWGIKFGIKAAGEAGVPLLANGKWEVSAETSFQYSWGGSESTKVGERVAAGPIAVQPGEMYRCVAIVRSGKIDVPYSGRAVLTYEDGTTVEADEAGVFDGAIMVDLNGEVTGPFKADPALAALGPGEHRGVPLSDRLVPDLRVQTVIVKA
jgi:hypothetical protein